MALKDPRFTKFKIGWHREPTPDGTPKWYAEMGGVRVAEAAMTGRSGVDDYPWEWFMTANGLGLARNRWVWPGPRTVGVSDTLRSAKGYVWSALVHPSERGDR